MYIGICGIKQLTDLNWIYDSQLESNCMIDRYSEIFLMEGTSSKIERYCLYIMKTEVGRDWYQSIHFDKLYLSGKCPFPGPKWAPSREEHKHLQRS